MFVSAEHKDCHATQVAVVRASVSRMVHKSSGIDETEGQDALLQSSKSPPTDRL